METIGDMFYFVYVIHQNAAIALWHFLMTNIAFAILLFCMFYVFNRQNIIVEKQTIRPIRRSYNEDPRRPEQKQWGGLADDIVLATVSKERIKLISLYLAIFCSILICFFFASRFVLYMITAMWIIGALSVFLLKGDRKEMADNIENYSLGYCLILIIIKVMIMLIIGTPASEWSRSLGVALPASAEGTLKGYLPMLFLIITIGLPIAYFKTVAQKWVIAKDNEDVSKRRAELMRTGNQDQLHEWHEDAYQHRHQW